MRPVRYAAVELLMSYPDATVAEMLGLRLSTLRRWLCEPGFAKALRDREREQKAGATRIARQAVVNAAAALCQLTSETSKPDAKVLLDVLKVSGAFDAETIDPADAIAEVISRISGEEVSPCD
ncbi:MAG: hypothetical protein NT018_10510 [Armatimonadetes bacterium]|nr:hypothetical protein [Armatimonadota bacterium]